MSQESQPGERFGLQQIQFFESSLLDRDYSSHCIRCHRAASQFLFREATHVRGLRSSVWANAGRSL